MQPRRRALALSALVLTATICTAPELCAQDGKAAVETAIMRVFEGMHTTSGTAYCWGENRYGALGDGTGINRTTPDASALVVATLTRLGRECDVVQPN